MTETSFFWEGALGDASLSPFDDAELAEYIYTLTGNFVVPGYYFTDNADTPTTELDVQTTANVGKVLVKPGAAMVFGYLYTNDADIELSIPSTGAVNPAIYRIILKLDTATQTVRLEVLEGAAAAVPEPPFPSTTTEYSIAWIWVEGTGSYDPALDTIPDTDIHDERAFNYTPPYSKVYAFDNIMYNGEFFGFSTLNGPPDGWANIGAHTNTPNTISTLIPRGGLIRANGAAGVGVEVTIPINNLYTDVYSLGGVFQSASGGMTVEISGQILGGGNTVLNTKTFFPQGGVREINDFYMRVTGLTSSHDALRIKFTSVGPAGGCSFGALRLSPGYIPGDMYSSRKHGVIWLDTEVHKAYANLATGLTTVGIPADFTTRIAPYIRGVIVRASISDTGSAAAPVDNGAAVEFYHAQQTPPGDPYLSSVSCAGKPNGTVIEGVVWIPIDPNDSLAQFKMYHRSPGATLDVDLYLIGIIT